MSTAFLEKGILDLLTLILLPFSSFSVSVWVLSRLALSRCIQLWSEHNLGGHRWRTGRTCLPMMPDGDWSYSPLFLFGIWGASIQSPGTASTSWQFSQDLPSEHDLWILWTDSACLCNCHSKVPQTGSPCLKDCFPLFFHLVFPQTSSATSTLVPQLQSYAQKSLGCSVFQLSLFQLSPLHICQNQWRFPQSHYIWHTFQGLPWMRICMWHDTAQKHTFPPLGYLMGMQMETY